MRFLLSSLEDTDILCPVAENVKVTSSLLYRLSISDVRSMNSLFHMHSFVFSGTSAPMGNALEFRLTMLVPAVQVLPPCVGELESASVVMNSACRTLSVTRASVVCEQLAIVAVWLTCDDVGTDDREVF